MFRFIVVVACLLVVSAFSPMRFASRSNMVMTASPQKAAGAALIASTFLAGPVLAVEGAAPKYGFFQDNALSSPFSYEESREDPIYSPYSPYGNGEKAAYNARKNGPEEVKFYKAILAESE
jgi:hypothetical protein